MPEINEKEIRMSQYEELKKIGQNPYPNLAKKTLSNEQAIINFDNLSSSKENIYLAGRVRSIRKHGGSTFCDLEDYSGKIQVYFKKDLVGDQKYKLFKEFVYIGDFIEVLGTLFKTRAGEVTLTTGDFKIITKSLQPLPEKWHGLKDTEERFRKRYLDLIINPEVKKRFIIRSQIIETIRQFLIGKGYIEVETPILQPIYGGGFAKPFITHHNALDIPLYLRISDELYLKRLLVGGFEKIFEFCKDFRNEGVDHYHNPEFTMLEAMTAYKDYTFSMDLIEEMYEYTALKVLGKTKINYLKYEIDLKRPWQRMTMVESIKKATNFDVSKIIKLDEIKSIANKLKIEKEKFDKLLSVGEVITLIFEEKVEPTLIQPTIIYNYPVEVSPLAKKHLPDPRYVERFEHFIFGKENGNNYSELNDPIELRKRFVDEKLKIEAGFEEAHQTDLDFVEAIEHGMPPATGIGIGIDRMVMLFTNAESIKEVIFFPTLRPKSEPLKNEDSCSQH